MAAPLPPTIFSPHSLNKSLIIDTPDISIGSYSKYHGIDVVIFSEAETFKLAEPLQFAFIGKFSHGTPSLKQLHQHFTLLKLTGRHSVHILNPKHILIILSNDADFARLWLRRIWYFDGFPMRLFKWSPEFNPKFESVVVPL
ncbi:hypothetical protein Pfo_027378 [Paulownia fortunei]|nr:hypothetical protein Pfo_027378 [Paulownia fortunei]